MRIVLAGIILFFLGLALKAQEDPIYFKRLNEPVENAFSLLVPKDWILEGGAIRLLDPNIAGVNNMVECKFDLAVKKDAEGSVMIRWLPELLCIDQSQAWGNPEDAIFNNTLVRRKRSPENFILEVAVPYAHPSATNIKIITGKAQPGLAAQYRNSMDPTLNTVTNMSYSAYLMEYSYHENGKTYQERMVTAIEDYGVKGGGLWKNRGTMLIRTPEGQLSSWEPVLSIIQNSGNWSLTWLTREINRQRQRSGQILATQQELQAIDNAINENRRKTYSEISKDMYLNLTGQNEYKNPFTDEIEVDTDNWKNRWVSSNGEIIYSNLPDYNPNADPKLNVTGFKLTRPGK